jgi:hypothetical protein
MNIELQRDHTGQLHLFVAGVPAHGAQVTGIGTANDGTQQAIITVPLAKLTLGEVRSVIPFVRPADRAA